MRFIKNKMKFMFWAILVSFGLSISNAWAMEEEDPQGAAMMAASKSGMPSPGMVTPMKRGMQIRVVPQSAVKATIKITNYCRQIIETLNNGNVDEALTLLNSFYKKIPSTLKNSTRKRTKGQTDADFELQLRKDALDYHKSLFFCLAMCLKMSVSTDDVKASENLAKNVSHNDDYSEISLKVKTAENQIYLITFNISETFYGYCVPTCISDIDENKEWNKKYKIDIKTSIFLLENQKVDDVINISRGYKTGNFFKNTTNALVPATSDTGVAPVRYMGNDKQAKNIKKRLELIFNAIPAPQRVYLEQYYQFLMFSLVNFMGSSLCFAEFITGDGRADLIIRTEMAGKLVGSIIELKRNKTSEEALVQIVDREYINSFDEEFQIVGISISGRGAEPVGVKCKREIISPKEASVKDSSLQIISHIPKLESKIQKAKVALQKAKVELQKAKVELQKAKVELNDTTNYKEYVEAILRGAKSKYEYALEGSKKDSANKQAAIKNAEDLLAKANEALKNAEKKYAKLEAKQAKAIIKKNGPPAKKKQKFEKSESEEETSEGEQK